MELLSIRLQDGGWGQAGLDIRTTPGSGPGQSFSIIPASDVHWDTGVAGQATKAKEEVGSDSAVEGAGARGSHCKGQPAPGEMETDRSSKQTEDKDVY